MPAIGTEDLSGYYDSQMQQAYANPYASPEDSILAAFITILGLGVIGASGSFGGGAVSVSAVGENELITWELARYGYAYGSTPEAVELAMKIAAQETTIYTAEELAAAARIQAFLDGASSVGSFVPPNFFGSY